jgi:hypothetical protein
MAARTDDRSARLRSSSGSASKRWYWVGTRKKTVARVASIEARNPAGENRASSAVAAPARRAARRRMPGAE